MFKKQRDAEYAINHTIKVKKIQSMGIPTVQTTQFLQISYQEQKRDAKEAYSIKVLKIEQPITMCMLIGSGFKNLKNYNEIIRNLTHLYIRYQ